MSRSRKQTQRPIPLDPELYAMARTEVYSRYKVHSAYRSGAVVRRYKELGGRYSGKQPKKTGIARWFRERWTNVGDDRYPVYRPTVRITSKTPLLPSEIDPADLKKKISMKQRLKHKTLPPFKARAKARK